jgi:tRNA A58 N-methylase Trm61
MKALKVFERLKAWNFLQIEIAEIVKRRTAYETSLIRKGSNERDWLEYIDYEKKLEKLRKLRCSKMSKFNAMNHLI